MQYNKKMKMVSLENLQTNGLAIFTIETRTLFLGGRHLWVTWHFEDQNFKIKKSVIG